LVTAVVVAAALVAADIDFQRFSFFSIHPIIITS
jgi:hypothetical protein